MKSTDNIYEFIKVHDDKPSLIIVEGPDFSGKTTFIQNMITKYNIFGIETIKAPFSDKHSTLRHLSTERETELKKRISEHSTPEQLHTIMKKCHIAVRDVIHSVKNTPTIFQDRNFFSTMVYQHDYIKNNVRLYSDMYAWRPSVPTMVVILMPSFKTIKERQLKRKKKTDELTYLELHIEMYYKRYQKFINNGLFDMYYNNIEVIYEKDK